MVVLANTALIKASLKTLLESITSPEPGIQNVYSYHRAVKTQDEFVDLFSHIDGSGNKIVTTWFLEPPRRATDPQSQLKSYTELWTFPILGYLGLRDQEESENTMGALLDAIRDKFTETGNVSLSGDVVAWTELRSSQEPPIFFGKYLCHLGLIELDIESRRIVT